ncbi:MAG: 50S ribosomal protein L13 [Candidatus Levybacteria bacterium CG10_big_fil_rev_8_21_14_0_10_35_13]|nr:MAG: 50S ribosomal protein L13 [Candidatus Levybacteria bacterium CG10_big_fil_rev_8_21_14_0_10_35_13]
MKHTVSTKKEDIKRDWHLVDVENKVLGRSASDIAKLLMGKNKPYFVRNLDCGDFVVVINAKDVKVTGKKESLKKYYRHSGYPGGFKSETLAELRNRNAKEIIIHAVSGMLPKNRLKAQMLKRLYVFEKENYIYQDKFFAKGESASGGKN